VDEDPVDPASGYDTAGHSLHGNGTAHI